MTITQAFLTSEISSLWPDNTTGAITPANARTTLNDIVTAIFQGLSPTTLSTPNTWTALQTFTGGSIVPTQSVGDNTTNAASTAFVQTQIASGVGLVNSVTNSDG